MFGYDNSAVTKSLLDAYHTPMTSCSGNHIISIVWWRGSSTPRWLLQYLKRLERGHRGTARSSALDASRGDALSIGPMSLAQLRATVADIRKGPVSAAAQERMQGVLESVRRSAPPDHVHGLSDDFKKTTTSHVKSEGASM